MADSDNPCHHSHILSPAVPGRHEARRVQQTAAAGLLFRLQTKKLDRPPVVRTPPFPANRPFRRRRITPLIRWAGNMEEQMAGIEMRRDMTHRITEGQWTRTQRRRTLGPLSLCAALSRCASALCCAAGRCRRCASLHAAFTHSADNGGMRGVQLGDRSAAALHHCLTLSRLLAVPHPQHRPTLSICVRSISHFLLSPHSRTRFGAAHHCRRPHCSRHAAVPTQPDHSHHHRVATLG